MTETKKTETKSLAEALVKFQESIPKVNTDKVNPHYKSKFASLANIVETVTPRLSSLGLAYSGKSRITEDFKMIFVAKLVHAPSGEFEEAEYPIHATDPQKIGSAESYFRRYGLAKLVGVVVDEDDDGNAASEAPRPQPRSLKQTKIAAENDGIKAAQDKVKAWTAGDEDRRKLANDTHTRLKAEYSGVELWEAIKKELGV